MVGGVRPTVGFAGTFNAQLQLVEGQQALIESTHIPNEGSGVVTRL